MDYLLGSKLVTKDHYNDGRSTVFISLTVALRDGVPRILAVKKLFELSSGENNTTEAENLFDAGVRAQLNDLGFQED